jgi:hypothetical protein
MNPPVQRSLPLSVSAQVVLATVDVARAVLGVDAESVVAQVEEGKIRWVWDFACPGSTRRELRFWVPELSSGTKPQPVEQVIAAVIGATPGGRQRAAIIEVRWAISAQLIMGLVRSGCWAEDRVGHTRYLRRASLERFLQERLIQ